jgi:hypothetical protein
MILNLDELAHIKEIFKTCIMYYEAIGDEDNPEAVYCRNWLNNKNI